MDTNMESPYVKVTRKQRILSSRGTQKNAIPMALRVSADSLIKIPRFFRSSNKSISNDPITGLVKKYEPYRSLSPLGQKNTNLSEKINNSFYTDKDYNFHRQTKQNPKYHSRNPITGELSHRILSKNQLPTTFQSNYSPDPYKMIRIYKGLGYKKSEIF